MVGQKCAVCRRVLAVGDWVTRESTLEHMVHFACPPKKPFLGRKVDREKPLLAPLWPHLDGE